MKTLTKTLFSTLLAAALLTSSALTTLAAGNTKITTSTTGINKIWVSGNVKVILTQSDKEGVFVGDNFNADKTSILRKGQTLYINSMENSVTINVSVKDLQRIEAAGSAVVVTNGNFDVKYLQVFLSQNATAKIKSTVNSLYTVTSGNATLKMSGTSAQHTLVASNIDHVKLNNFTSLKTENLSAVLAAKADNVIAQKAK